jgi:hypothetical protein
MTTARSRRSCPSVAAGDRDGNERADGALSFDDELGQKLGGVGDPFDGSRTRSTTPPPPLTRRRFSRRPATSRPPAPRHWPCTPPSPTCTIPSCGDCSRWFPTPVDLIWGERDQIAPEPYGRAYRRLIPQRPTLRRSATQDIFPTSNSLSRSSQRSSVRGRHSPLGHTAARIRPSSGKPQPAATDHEQGGREHDRQGDDHR